MNEDDPHGDFHTLNVRLVEPAPTVREKITGVYRVITVTPSGQQGSGPVQQLLPESDNRVCAYVQALDDDAFLASTEADAANRSGMPLLLKNTAPWPILDQGPVFVGVPTMGGQTSRIAVSVYYRTRG